MNASMCIAVVLIAAIVVGGPTYCSIQEDAQITKRIEAACNGDASDPSRSSTCTLAVLRRAQR